MKLLYLAAALYPALVFCGLVIFKIPFRFFSLALAAAGLFLFIAAGKKKTPEPLPSE